MPPTVPSEPEGLKAPMKRMVGFVCKEIVVSLIQSADTPEYNQSQAVQATPTDQAAQY